MITIHLREPSGKKGAEKGSGGAVEAVLSHSNLAI
jgi:hypothetical protein